MIGKFRKIHLFDVDIPATETRDAIHFVESETFSPGNYFTIIKTSKCLVVIQRYTDC